jgi:hypothetical protein
MEHDFSELKKKHEMSKRSVILFGPAKSLCEINVKMKEEMVQKPSFMSLRVSDKNLFS